MEQIKKFPELPIQLNFLKKAIEKNISLDAMIVDIDLMNITKEQADYLVKLNQIYESTPCLLSMFPENVQTILLKNLNQSIVYMDILPKIAKGEVGEGEVEDYLLRIGLELQRKRMLQYFADRLE